MAFWVSRIVFVLIPVPTGKGRIHAFYFPEILASEQIRVRQEAESTTAGLELDSSARDIRRPQSARNLYGDHRRRYRRRLFAGRDNFEQ